MFHEEKYQDKSLTNKTSAHNEFHEYYRLHKEKNQRPSFTKN